MTFSRVKTLGWSVGEKLASADMNQLDEDHANAIDGKDGGDYTPTSPINITGSHGLGNVTVSGDMTWDASNYPKLSTRSVTVWVPHSCGYVSNVDGNGDPYWTLTTGGGNNNFMPVLLQTSVSSNGAVWFPIRPPVGSIVTGFAVGLIGNYPGGGDPTHAGIPQNAPTIWLARHNGSTTIITGKNEDAASAAAYDGQHTISLTGITETISSSYQYYLRITGESGTNSLADKLAIRFLRYTVSVSEIRPVT
jgi:hypothetical protein